MIERQKPFNPCRAEIQPLDTKPIRLCGGRPFLSGVNPDGSTLAESSIVCAACFAVYLPEPGDTLRKAWNRSNEAPSKKRSKK